MILRVMEMTGVEDTSQVISVGDTAADIRSAQAAGVTSVGVLTGHLSLAQFVELGAGQVLRSVADIADAVGTAADSVRH